MTVRTIDAVVGRDAMRPAPIAGGLADRLADRSRPPAGTEPVLRAPLVARWRRHADDGILLTAGRLAWSQGGQRVELAWSDVVAIDLSDPDVVVSYTDTAGLPCRTRLRIPPAFRYLVVDEADARIRAARRGLPRGLSIPAQRAVASRPGAVPAGPAGAAARPQ